MTNNDVSIYHTKEQIKYQSNNSKEIEKKIKSSSNDSNELTASIKSSKTKN